MAITSTTKTRTGPNNYRLRAVSNLADPVYYWWNNGALVAVGNMPFRDVTVAPGEVIDIDVFDSSTDVPGMVYPGRVTLEWENIAASYAIKKWIGGEWVTQTTLVAGPLGSMRWASPVLADSTEHLFCVTPIGEDGNEGIAREFTVFMVRKPDEVAAAYTYDPLTGELEAA